VKVCTLLLLVRDDQILLAMKKRGFGAGRWNGVGGKVEPDESIEAALIRECQEEIHVTPTHFEKVAVHDFIFPEGMSNMQVHTFVSDQWEGEPTETDEMAPQWFNQTDIPYEQMWQDDSYWIPQVLAGKKLHCRFMFDEKENLIDGKVHELPLV